MDMIDARAVLESPTDVYRVATHARGPAGMLPITAEMLLNAPSGSLFGLTQNAGMGWDPARLLDPEFLILSTHGGLRAEDGTPIALGFHSGHWEVGLLVAEAARELKALHAVPFAGACTDPCDGRTQGTTGMLDSLPYRNDAAIVLRRLMRSLPTPAGVLGVATCDTGLPAMMMALASSGPLPLRHARFHRHHLRRPCRFGGIPDPPPPPPPFAHRPTASPPLIKRLGTYQPPGPAPRRRPSQRPGKLRHRASLPRRRRTRGH